jgi:hypothetical protein
MSPAVEVATLLALPVAPILGLAAFASGLERVQQRWLTRRAARTWLREGGDPRLVRAWKRAGRPSVYDVGRWTTAGLPESAVLTWQVAGWRS